LPDSPWTTQAWLGEMTADDCAITPNTPGKHVKLTPTTPPPTMRDCHGVLRCACVIVFYGIYCCRATVVVAVLATATRERRPPALLYLSHPPLSITMDLSIVVRRQTLDPVPAAKAALLSVYRRLAAAKVPVSRPQRRKGEDCFSHRSRAPGTSQSSDERRPSATVSQIRLYRRRSS
jgi:hypothetical protein